VTAERTFTSCRSSRCDACDDWPRPCGECKYDELAMMLAGALADYPLADASFLAHLAHHLGQSDYANGNGFSQFYDRLRMVFRPSGTVTEGTP
jgi:hypothetical protein